ncbi:MAG: FmdB family zinc ribbon protein [Thermodesulfobacteriota bacterium]
MPIYEFYCQACHTIFNFFSRRINTTAEPLCPRCQRKLRRQLSTFATIGKARENNDDFPAGIDEARMERVLADLARQAEQISEDDPRQMAQLMRRFSTETGMSLGEGMKEALARMEAGEDPEKIEADMSDLLEDEDPFGAARKKLNAHTLPPAQDDTLYEL